MSLLARQGIHHGIASIVNRITCHPSPPLGISRGISSIISRSTSQPSLQQPAVGHQATIAQQGQLHAPASWRASLISQRVHPYSSPYTTPSFSIRRYQPSIGAHQSPWNSCQGRAGQQSGAYHIHNTSWIGVPPRGHPRMYVRPGHSRTMSSAPYTPYYYKPPKKLPWRERLKQSMQRLQAKLPKKKLSRLPGIPDPKPPNSHPWLALFGFLMTIPCMVGFYYLCLTYASLPGIVGGAINEALNLGKPAIGPEIPYYPYLFVQELPRFQTTGDVLQDIQQYRHLILKSYNLIKIKLQYMDQILHAHNLYLDDLHDKITMYYLKFDDEYIESLQEVETFFIHHRSQNTPLSGGVVQQVKDNLDNSIDFLAGYQQFDFSKFEHDDVVKYAASFKNALYDLELLMESLGVAMYNIEFFEKHIINHGLRQTLRFYMDKLNNATAWGTTANLAGVDIEHYNDDIVSFNQHFMGLVPKLLEKQVFPSRLRSVTEKAMKEQYKFDYVLKRFFCRDIRGRFYYIDFYSPIIHYWFPAHRKFGHFDSSFNFHWDDCTTYPYDIPADIKRFFTYNEDDNLYSLYDPLKGVYTYYEPVRHRTFTEHLPSNGYEFVDMLTGEYYYSTFTEPGKPPRYFRYHDRKSWLDQPKAQRDLEYVTFFNDHYDEIPEKDLEIQRIEHERYIHEDHHYRYEIYAKSASSHIPLPTLDDPVSGLESAIKKPKTVPRLLSKEFSQASLKALGRLTLPPTPMRPPPHTPAQVPPFLSPAADKSSGILPPP